MTDKQTQEQAPKGNMLKDPDQWTTGEEPMTGAQRSYLKTAIFAQRLEKVKIRVC
jgi:hypothetical protein